MVVGAIEFPLLMLMLILLLMFFFLLLLLLVVEVVCSLLFLVVVVVLVVLVVLVVVVAAFSSAEEFMIFCALHDFCRIYILYAHVQSSDVTRVHSGTEWIASVHALHMPKALM